MGQHQSKLSDQARRQLTQQVKDWAIALGFQQVGISDTDLSNYIPQYELWLKKNYHGDMEWMASHGSKRTHPSHLVTGTRSVISVRMNYLPEPQQQLQALLDSPQKAFISRYALGRDYHKLLRKRLQQLAEKIQNEVNEFGYRVFVDSAPVLEKPLAEKAGLGWIGKHSNLLNKDAGSWFFLGELFTDLELIPDTPTQQHCGTCTACIDACPTNAIVEPYVVDARRCISYLTIELKEAIPPEFRSLIGNRIYGCDDCQLVCPWNRFAHLTSEPDFMSRHSLDTLDLITAFKWNEESFLKLTEGSAIRRIGYERWIRNVAVALGNSTEYKTEVLNALKEKPFISEMVQEHIDWAIKQLS